MKIVGGSSYSGKISIFSDQFVAIARSSRRGVITCEVTRRPVVSNFLSRHKYLPMPLLVKMLLRLIEDFTKKQWLFIGLFAFLIYGIGPILRNIYPPRPDAVTYKALGPCLWILNAAFIVYVLTYMRRYIATWHGAEHMAIAAYERNGSTSIEQIAQECPVNDQCGGRFSAPIIMAILTSVFVSESIGVNQTVVCLMFLECILWVDRLIGFEKIPITSHLSHLLQKYITTQKPGTQELLTAQQALLGLIAAHENI